jgi:hypothetical protein
MTCHHVIRNLETAKESRFELDFYELDDGTVAMPVFIALDPEKLFLTTKDLDITLVALQPHPTLSDRKSLWPEASGDLLVGESLNIIHHAGGEPLRWTLRSSAAIDISNAFIHYTGDMGPGSAGAPVFNDQWELVGVHHASVPRRGEDGRILARDGSLWQSHSGTSFEILANEAIRLSSIGAWLRSAGIDTLDQARLPIDIRPDVDPPGGLRESRTRPFIPSVDDTIRRDSVFISYAHADQVHEKWKDRLLVYLRGIPSIGVFRVWDDSRIQPGQEWRSEIEYALKRTKVAVLMIGPNFLASEFIKSNELPSILGSSENEGVRILPIVTDYAPYKHTDLGRFQAINAPDAPLESLSRSEQNRLLLRLAEAVAEVFDH